MVAWAFPCFSCCTPPGVCLRRGNKQALLRRILACALQECARYLETLRAYEQRPADAIQGRTEADYLSRLTAVLTTVRGVNKTDVLTLGNKFGTAADMFAATPEVRHAAYSCCEGTTTALKMGDMAGTCGGHLMVKFEIDQM